MPARRLAAAIALTALNYATLTGYDFLAFAYIGKTLSRWRVAVASFLAYAIANNVGFALLSGASVRYRFYTRWGITGDELSRIVFAYSVTFWLGLFTLGGLTLAFSRLPEVAFVFSRTGTSDVTADPVSPNESDTYIILKPQHEWPDPKLSKHDLIEHIEDLVSEKLMLPVHVTRVVANRMRLTLSEGLVLNVMTMPAPRTPAEAAVAGIVRSALAAVTRGEAERWAPQGIRVNAVGPSATVAAAGAALASEPDIASLALYLASRPGRTLTGQVFDAAGVARRGC